MKKTTSLLALLNFKDCKLKYLIPTIIFGIIYISSFSQMMYPFKGYPSSMYYEIPYKEWKKMNTAEKTSAIKQHFSDKTIVMLKIFPNTINPEDYSDDQDWIPTFRIGDCEARTGTGDVYKGTQLCALYLSSLKPFKHVLQVHTTAINYSCHYWVIEPGPNELQIYIQNGRYFRYNFDAQPGTILDFGFLTPTYTYEGSKKLSQWELDQLNKYEYYTKVISATRYFFDWYELAQIPSIETLENFKIMYPEVYEVYKNNIIPLNISQDQIIIDPIR